MSGYPGHSTQDVLANTLAATPNEVFFGLATKKNTNNVILIPNIQ